MPKIRASHIGSEYDPDRSDPVIVARDTNGAWGLVTEYLRTRGELISADLAGYDQVLAIEAKR